MRIGFFVQIFALSVVSGAPMPPTPVASSESDENTLFLRGDTTEAQVTVWQSPQARNSAALILNGADALSDRPTWLRETSSTLRPNALMQLGEGHLMDITITGKDNQVAVTQSGMTGTATINVSGRLNMTAIQQFGRGDTVSVRQSGSANTVAISQ